MSDQGLDTVFGTRFFVPTWWVRAYEAACGESSLDRTVLEAATEAGLTPRLSPEELNGFTVILASLQQQLFQGEATLHLDPERHRKFITSTARSKAVSFDRAIQEVTAIKLMHADERGYHLLPIFTHEFWRKIDRRTPSLKIELTVSEYGIEALLGVGEPYTNLLRAGLRKPTIQSVLGTTGPLGLGRSAWLDLQGVEQLLLLRLEKAMQWDFRWLQLDGVFGIGLEELFRGFTPPKYRSKELAGTSNFKAKSKILQKFGNKLIDHGMLIPEVSSQYFAVGHEDSRPPMTLAWQIPMERLQDAEGKEFAAKASECLLNLVLMPKWNDIVRMLAGPVWSEGLSRLSLSLARAYHEDRDGVFRSTAFWFDNNLPVPTVTLFLEWYCRLQPEHPFPMPKAVLGLEIIKIVQIADESNIQEQFRQFSAWLHANPDMVQEIKRIGAISLVEPTMAKDARVLKFVSGERQRVTEKPKARVEEPVQTRAEVLAETAVAKSKTLSEVANKKLVMDELNRLREKSPEHYVTLKRMYYSSLTPQRHEVILDIQKKLSPKVFEDTLRPSLTKFVMENPGVWEKLRQNAPQA